MAKLTHSHRLMKDQVNHHVDSKGVQFGNDEHVVALKDFDWADHTVSEQAITHTHLHIREEISNQGDVIMWQYSPPNAREAEREIGQPAVVARK